MERPKVKRQQRVLLIVRRDDQSFQIDSVISLEQENRLQEIVTGNEQVMASFACEKLEIRFVTQSGSVIILHT